MLSQTVDAVLENSVGHERKIGYSDWNEALCEAFFSSERAGQLVYLDRDDDSFAQAYSSLGQLTEEAALASLVDAVRSNLRWHNTQRATFAEYDMMTKRWLFSRKAALRNQREVPSPPHVALLMVMSVAAESMGGSNEQGNAANASYYSQLGQLLRVPAAEAARLKTYFMESNETYWEALSLWLEDNAGNRGLPSAYALMYRYVGLPISQALIRDTERRNLAKLFDEQGFIAGSTVSQIEMYSALDVWINAQGSSANQGLRKMWDSTSTRDRITELALAQFSAWEGPTSIQLSGEKRSTRGARGLLTWRTERKFVSSVSKFGLVVMQGSLADDIGTIETQTGDQLEVRFVSTGHGGFGVDFGSHIIAPESLVASDIKITTTDQALFRRIPKNVVLFAREALAASYVEIDRALAGKSMRLLVKQTNALNTQVDEILQDAAQPGYRRVDGGTGGVPEGWVAYFDVVLLRAPAPHLVQAVELSAFQPRLSTQMSLQGGMKLPGRVARWSSKAPLSLLITSDEGKPVDLFLVQRDPGTLKSIETRVRTGLVPPCELNVGELSREFRDFTISLRQGNKTLQNLQVRLRDSDSESKDTDREFRFLGHLVGSQLWPLRSVSDEENAQQWVDGTSINAELIPAVLDGWTPPRTPGWTSAMNVARAKQKIRLPDPSKDSCIVTGLHRFTFPSFDGTYPKSPWMYGECIGCGMSKRQPTRPRQRGEANSIAHSQPMPTMPAAISDTPSWEALIDALTYLGTGTRREFSVLARQIEDSALFEHRLLSSLEALSIIEVERDENWNVVYWEIAGTGVSELADGSWLLTGSWVSGSSQQLTELAEDAGGDVTIIGPDAQRMIRLDGIIPEVIGSLANEIFDEDVVHRNIAETLVGILPPLSQLINELPRGGMPFAGSYEYFNVQNASWAETEQALIPGLYRLPRFAGSGYYLRTTNDISEGTAARVAVDFGKHMAANILGRPLLAYDPSTKSLLVPMGAELPGLYGRAAVFGTGELPLPKRQSHSMGYLELPDDTAYQLIRKMSS